MALINIDGPLACSAAIVVELEMIRWYYSIQDKLLRLASVLWCQLKL